MLFLITYYIKKLIGMQKGLLFICNMEQLL